MDPPGPVRLRPLDATFGRECLAINRACPIEAEFTLRFDREPDFFAWPERVFDSFEYLGIFAAGRLVGYFLTGLRTGWTGSKWGRWAYFGDYRIAPEFRGRNLGFRILAEVVRRLPGDVENGCFVIAQGNRTAGFVRLPGFLQADVRHAGLLEVHSLPVFRQPAYRATCPIRSMEPDDRPALESLVCRQWHGRLFGPGSSNDPSTRELEEACSRGGVLVAHNGSRLCGVVAWTYLEDVRRTTVVRYPVRSWPIRVLWKAARRLNRRVTDLPEAGEAIRSATVILLAAEGDDPRILRELIIGVRRAQAGRGIHLVQVAGFSGQNVLEALRGMLRVRFSSDVWIATRRNVPPADILRRPPVIDLALI